SIQNVSRIVHDIDQKRLLIDEHILVSTPQEWAALETRISEVDDDLRIAAAAYTPLTTFPGERKVWDQLRAEIAGLQPPIEKVLDLRRRNLDAEARAAMTPIARQFEAINRAAEELIRINQETARDAATQVREQQRRLLIFLGGITLAGTALAVFAAWWVTR